MSDQQELVDVLYRDLAGPESIPVKLRLRAGLDQVQVARVEDAIRRLTQFYADKSLVPKKLAAAFLELPVAMAWHGGDYPGAIQDEIEATTNRLLDLAGQLFDGEDR